MQAAQLKGQIEKQLGETVAGVFELRSRAPVHVSSTGSVALDEALRGGLPRGAVTEMYGSSSSGRTSAAYGALAQATRRGELCAVLDVNDAFSPVDAQNAGIVLSRVLWVRCGSLRTRPGKRTNSDGCAPKRTLSALEQALKCADLILRNGGFGVVLLDMGHVPATEAKRVPLTSWFRFRRTIEGTSTALLVIAQVPCAVSCSSALLHFERTSDRWAQASDSKCGRALPGSWTPRTFSSAQSRLLSSVRVYCSDVGKRHSTAGDFRWDETR